MSSSSLSNFWRIGRKILCVGRNYKEHALELGNKIPDKPVIFVKTTNSYIVEGEPIRVPPGCKNLHQEVELGVIFSEVVKNVKKSEALKYVGGYIVALDMTARDLQDEAKKGGLPWYIAKSFDGSCPVSRFLECSEVPDPHNEELFCLINGKEQQRSKTDAMLFDIPTLIEYITQFITLNPGDVLLTGTPSGVSRVKPGDEIEFGLEGKVRAKFVVE